MAFGKPKEQGGPPKGPESILMKEALGIVLLVVAVAFLLTSLVSHCPGYLPFGLSTRGKADPPA